MRRFVPVLIAVVVAVLVLATRGGGESYTLKMRLADAGGLRNGSPVVIGGVPVGQVRLSAHRAFVEARLEIKPKYAPIGKGVVAGVIAQNVIGQKQVRLQGGNRADPARSGYELPAKQVLQTTDLDQLLDTLDPDTRTRLAILIDETGTAFAGRKLDFSSFLKDVPAAFANGGEVLGALTKDNRALENLIRTSDPFVAELARQRKHFVRVLANAGETADTISARRGELRATLREAPRALRTTRRFLTDLQQTTQPLGQTARLLTATAPSLSAVLGRIAPFEHDAGPTIKALAPLGPLLGRTAVETAPIVAKLSRATGNLRALAGNELPPAGDTLNGSADNLIATLDNWSHAIQFRDAAGHVFRGEASLAPDFAYQSLIDRLLTPAQRAAVRRHGEPARTPPKLPAPTGTPAPAVTPSAPAAKPAPSKLPPVSDIVKGLLPGLAPPGTPPGGDDKSSGVKSLLNYLLGS